MKSIEIPSFVKHLGHRIFSYILNFEEEKALQLLDDKLILDSGRQEVLSAFIQICRQLRIRAIDQVSPDSLFIFELSRLVQNKRHIFNIWREQLGGETLSPNTADRLVSIVSRIAL